MALEAITNEEGYPSLPPALALRFCRVFPLVRVIFWRARFCNLENSSPVEHQVGIGRDIKLLLPHFLFLGK
jgi:hypothetical protein